MKDIQLTKNEFKKKEKQTNQECRECEQSRSTFRTISGRVRIRTTSVIGHAYIVNKFDRGHRFYPNRYYAPNKCNSHDFSLHAEANALRSLYHRKIKNQRNLTLIVIRISKNGELMMSRPCTHCLWKIKNSGIKNVIYSVPGGLVCKNINDIDSIPVRAMRLKENRKSLCLHHSKSHDVNT